MKYNGKKLNGPEPVIVVFDRTNQQIVFTLEAVLAFDEFDKLVPDPTPPSVLHRDGSTGTNLNDSEYMKKLNRKNQLRTYWIILKTLSPTKELEWETVDLSKPDTWELYTKELQEGGFTPLEIQYLVKKVFELNTIDEKRMDEARARFLALRPETQPAK